MVTLSSEVIPDERFARSARFSVPPGALKLLHIDSANSWIRALDTVRKRGARFFSTLSACSASTGEVDGSDVSMVVFNGFRRNRRRIGCGLHRLCLRDGLCRLRRRCRRSQSRQTTGTRSMRQPRFVPEGWSSNKRKATGSAVTRKVAFWRAGRCRQWIAVLLLIVVFGVVPRSLRRNRWSSQAFSIGRAPSRWLGVLIEHIKKVNERLGRGTRSIGSSAAERPPWPRTRTVVSALRLRHVTA